MILPICVISLYCNIKPLDLYMVETVGLTETSIPYEKPPHA